MQCSTPYICSNASVFVFGRRFVKGGLGRIIGGWVGSGVSCPLPAYQLEPHVLCQYQCQCCTSAFQDQCDLLPLVAKNFGPVKTKNSFRSAIHSTSSSTSSSSHQHQCSLLCQRLLAPGAQLVLGTPRFLMMPRWCNPHSGMIVVIIMIIFMIIVIVIPRCNPGGAGGAIHIRLLVKVAMVSKMIGVILMTMMTVMMVMFDYRR